MSPRHIGATITLALAVSFAVGSSAAQTQAERPAEISWPEVKVLPGSLLEKTLAAGDGDLVLIGDMLVHPEQLNAPAGREAQQVYGATNFLWPRRKLPIKFSAGISRAEQKFFRKACKAWKKRGVGIKCVRYTNQTDFVSVSNEDSGCWSGVGYSAGRGEHRLNLQGDLGKSGCWFEVIVRHELAHRFGLFHEQNRTDRNRFLKIKKKQIQPGALRNFEIIPGFTIFGKYDFQSLMHYGSNAFAVGNKATIVPRAGFKQFSGRAMGPQGPLPTKLDYAGVKRLYANIPR